MLMCVIVSVCVSVMYEGHSSVAPVVELSQCVTAKAESVVFATGS